MINILKAIVLGIIEGITEFLPISSTGHLIIFSNIISFFKDNPEFVHLFNVFIQIGAIFAVVVYFREKIFSPFLSNKNRNKKIENNIEKSSNENQFVNKNSPLKEYLFFWLKVLVAFIPTVVAGVLFADTIEEYLFKPIYVAVALIIGAVLMFVAELMLKKPKVEDDRDITFIDAIAIGLFQCLALWPGMSRSASTIVGGLFRKFSRTLAAEFSFFLAIPTIIGASFYSLLKVIIKGSITLGGEEIMLLAVGTIVSFLVALVVVALFMNFVKKRPLYIFAIYRVLLAIAIFILYFTKSGILQ